MIGDSSQNTSPGDVSVHPVRSSVSPTARQVWSRTRGVVLAMALLLLTGLGIAALRSGDNRGLLDPGSASPTGSRAVAQLLESHGVDIRVVSTTHAAARAAARDDTTLLVTKPELLTAHQLSTLRTSLSDSGSRMVALGPGPGVVDVLAPKVRAVGETQIATRDADCTAQFARNAGAAELGGHGYATSADPVDTCYPSEGLPTLVRVPQPSGSGDSVVVGTPELLYNDHLANHGNASLMLQLLGSKTHLTWYLPSLADPAADDSGDEGLLSLLPAGWRWGAVQLTLAVALAAIWRARRLGPVVSEALPVTVYASETTEGRARLYRRSNARERAAEALRSASRERLAPLAGVAEADAHDPDILCTALSSHASGEADAASRLAATNSLLFGQAPRNDDELVLLAERLDRFQRHVTSSRTDKERPS